MSTKNDVALILQKKDGNSEKTMVSPIFQSCVKNEVNMPMTVEMYW